MASRSFDKIRDSRNELEALLRIKGISKANFGRILDVCEATAERYIREPQRLRYSHMKLLGKFCNLEVKEVIDVIEYDLTDQQDEH